MISFSQSVPVFVYYRSTIAPSHLATESSMPSVVATLACIDSQGGVPSKAHEQQFQSLCHDVAVWNLFIFGRASLAPTNDIEYKLLSFPLNNTSCFAKSQMFSLSFARTLSHTPTLCSCRIPSRTFSHHRHVGGRYSRRVCCKPSVVRMMIAFIITSDMEVT